MIRLVSVMVVPLAALLFTAADGVAAQSVPGHVFAGTATVDGSPAPDGSLVTAWIEERKLGSAKVADGKYMLFAKQADGASNAGETVIFQIGDALANETATRQKDGADELNLTGSSQILRSVMPMVWAVGAVTATGIGESSGPKAEAASATGTSPMGAKGEPGPAGPKGEPGPSGPPRASGSFILSIVAIILAALAIATAGGVFVVARGK